MPTRFFLLGLMIFTPPTVIRAVPARNTRIPTCAEHSKDHALIGWGKYGLFFSVPKHGIKILGGKPDVDYVRFVIRPQKRKASLILWFGSMAFQQRPPAEIIRNSETFTRTKLSNSDGAEIGLDSKGTKHDKTRWRWFGVWAEGGEYEDVLPDDAALFDQILDSACLIPHPRH